jgi:Fe-S-cluster containining protein
MIQTRQARRARLRDLDALATKVAATGLPRTPGPDQLLAAVGRLARQLAAAKSSATVADIAATAHRLFERSLAAAPAKVPVACKQGCAWCCYNAVSATVPEILLVAQAAATERMLDRPSVQNLIAAAAGLSGPDRMGRKIACPMLEADGCAVYAQRPTMCRVANSTDVEACIDEYEGRNLTADIPMARAPVDHGFNTRVVLVAAIRASGLDASAYDLAAGLGAGTFEAAAARWLAGQPAWDGVKATSLDPQVDALARDLSEAWRNLAAG